MVLHTSDNITDDHLRLDHVIVHTESFGTDLAAGLCPGIVASVGTLDPVRARAAMSDYVTWRAAQA